MFCAHEVVQLSPVVFRVFRDVHKFFCSLIINESPKNGNRYLFKKTTSCGHSGSCFWQDLYVFIRPSSRVLRDSARAVKVTYILLGKRQYLMLTILL
jgi:hypothetical protein